MPQRKSKKYNLKVDEIELDKATLTHCNYNKINNNNIWGLQYHPEITYQKMIQLIKFRKDRLIETRKVFANHDQVDEHISFIEKEISISDNQQRMIELRNWLNSI